MALGSNQVALGADWAQIETNNLHDGSERLVPLVQEQKEFLCARSEESIDHLFLPFKDACLNIEDPELTASPDLLHRLWNLVPTSFQNKMTTKHKPVITWKPYHRPINPSSSSSIISTNLENYDTIPSVVLEDNSSFVWRTIGEESESLVTANSNFALSDSSLVGTMPEIFTEKDSLRSQHLKPDFKGISENILYPKFNLVKSIRRNNKSLHLPKERWLHPKVKRRTRYHSLPSFYTYTSLPYIPVCRCGHKAISVKLLKSLSEASIFLEAISTKVQELKVLQANLDKIKQKTKRTRDSRKTKSVEYIGNYKARSKFNLN